MTLLIAGGGIAGLSLALTCHQIGVPFRIFEATDEIRPLGVGINLQPSAVRELYDLGLEHDLPSIAVETRDYGMYSKYGLEIWLEPRGKWAGYNWPQFSVHRGELQMLLYRTLIERAGPECIETGWSATGFRNIDNGAVLELISSDGSLREETGSLVMGADGIHSAIRAQMEPDEGPPVWGGFVLWRGTTKARPYKTGASMVMVGHDAHRFVAYPISGPDPESGLITTNWIASLKFEADAAWNKEDWNRVAKMEDFLPRYMDWKFDWLDIPALIQGADQIFEYPMVDRDPIQRWTHGRVSLTGDAAHAAYPVGSNGAGQAIVDARKLGRCFLEHGVGEAALQAFEAELLPATSRMTLTNRGSGPDAVLDMVDKRCGGWFENIDDVISREELAAHAAKYKALAGFSIEDLNKLPPIIPPGSTIGEGS